MDATDSLLHRCEIRCTTRAAGASLRAEEKERGTGGEKGRKEERKRRNAGREVLLREETLPFRRFSALVPSRGAIRVKEERRGPGGSEKWGLRRGHVSRSGHLPLKRTHCYVPIISFTLAANLPFSPFFFLLFLLLLSPLPHFFQHCSLALRLLVSRNKQLPFFSIKRT